MNTIKIGKNMNSVSRRNFIAGTIAVGVGSTLSLLVSEEPEILCIRARTNESCYWRFSSGFKSKAIAVTRKFAQSIYGHETEFYKQYIKDKPNGGFPVFIQYPNKKISGIVMDKEDIVEYEGKKEWVKLSQLEKWIENG